MFRDLLENSCFIVLGIKARIFRKPSKCDRCLNGSENVCFCSISLSQKAYLYKDIFVKII